MKRFIVYNKDGKILRHGGCPDYNFNLQAQENEFVMEGTANDLKQKVEFFWDIDHNPIDPRVINKTPEEIEAENPPDVQFEKQIAHITNKQWQDVLVRLDKLESGDG